LRSNPHSLGEVGLYRLSVSLGWDPNERPEHDGARWGREQSQQTLHRD